MELLKPLLIEPDGYCKDNAIASITRMIVANEQNMPIAEIVPNLMNYLPLKFDMEENATVCLFVNYLIKKYKDFADN